MKIHAFVLALCAAISLGGRAIAMEPTAPEAKELMQDYFGNTRICHVPFYFECHVWTNPDGSYVIFTYNSERAIRETKEPRSTFNVVRGKWWIEGTKGNYRLCRQTEDAKPPAPNAQCGLPEPLIPHMSGTERQHLGDLFWRYHDDTGLKGTTEYYFMAKGHI